jgi:hypothetical protein
MRALAVVAALSLAAGFDEADFRWTRTVSAPGGGLVAIEPDGPMFEHARVGFADLRVVDANGAQVPWRPAPPPRTSGLQRATVLNSGRRGAVAVALLDLGPRRAVRDRIELDVPERGFVGRVVVLGADRREGPFTRLSATGIYDVAGATRARSTTAIFPPTDFRFFSIRATGVSRIDGAIVSRTEGRPATVERKPRRIYTRQSGRRTIVTLDFDHLNVPVDELRVSSRSPVYNRALVVEASNDRFGRRWIPVTAARIARFEGSTPGPIPLGARARYVRVKIDNGDDPPLAAIRVEASSRSHALVLEGGHARPYRLLYGSPALRAPEYEFARIPLDPNAPTVRGTLGAEGRNPAFELPGKSFGARYRWLLQAALVLAAIAVAGAGFLALRRRT